MDPSWDRHKVSLSDTDQELEKHTSEDNFQDIRASLTTEAPIINKKRYRQLYRWNKGANYWIVTALRRSRIRWATFFMRMVERQNYRRSKLLAIIYQQHRLSSVRAVEGVIMSRLFRLFNKRLTPVQKMLIAEFIP